MYYIWVSCSHHLRSNIYLFRVFAEEQSLKNEDESVGSEKKQNQNHTASNNTRPTVQAILREDKMSEDKVQQILLFHVFITLILNPQFRFFFWSWVISYFDCVCLWICSWFLFKFVDVLFRRKWPSNSTRRWRRIKERDCWQWKPKKERSNWIKN